MYTVAYLSLEHNVLSQPWAQLLISALNTMAYPCLGHSCLFQSWTIIVYLTQLQYTQCFIPERKGRQGKRGKGQEKKTKECVNKVVEERKEGERKQRDGKKEKEWKKESK